MLTDPARAFLATTRLGFFSYRVETTGWSRPVPVWFEWATDTARVFSSATAPKVEHLRADPVAHLLVANQVGEPEAWVSITANVELGPVDPDWLRSLSARYWDLEQDEHRSVVDGWLEDLDALVLLTLRPTKLRESGF